MPIPDYESIMLPLLQFSGDGKLVKFGDACDHFGSFYKLTEAELEQLLPSGRYPVFRSRFSWAKTYLTKAKILESPTRGTFQITQRGRDLLQSPPPKITSLFLRRYPEFVQFQQGNDGTTASVVAASVSIPVVASTTAVLSAAPEQTPDELLDNAYGQLRKSLAEDLLEQIKQTSPRFFEILVVDVLVAMGYGGSSKDAAQVVGKSGDGGIDGIIKEDHLGLGAIYVQAKKWDNVVPRPEIQKFVGALQGNQASKGVFITTSTFSDGAKEYVKNWLWILVCCALYR